MTGFQKNNGFSLTEVLLAVGVLGVGMLFVAGTFPVALHFSTLATERTIAAVAADEAFAKIRLYAVGEPNQQGDDIDLGEFKDDELTAFDSKVLLAVGDSNTAKCKFLYPSTGDEPERKRYRWSALGRLLTDDPNSANRMVQVTVFVCRKSAVSLKYPDPNSPASGQVDWPMPVRMGVSAGSKDDELKIDSGYEKFVCDGSTIVDDATGRIYRVQERYPSPDEDTIRLDRKWDDRNLDLTGGGNSPRDIWVVPPAVGGGRNPCIAVYQKVIAF